MPPLLRPGAAVPRRAALLPALLALVIAACTSAPSFDPAGPCVVDGQAIDGRAAGAYPALEALVPDRFDGRPPDRLDSGRNCTDRNLGSLRARGIDEVRFAGGFWELSDRSGVSLAVFQGAGLTTASLFEFYETGARAAPKTTNIEPTEMDVAGVPARRLDTLNDESYQTVIVWAGRDGVILVVLVGSDIRETQTRPAHELRVSAALAAFGSAR